MKHKVKKLLQKIIVMFNPRMSAEYIKLNNEHMILKADFKILMEKHNDYSSGKLSKSTIAGMNYKQIEEMKNFYVNNIGHLPKP